MDVVEVVESYLAAGLPVLPLHVMRNGTCTCGRPSGTGDGECHSPAKHPITQHGKDDATTDPEIVSRWLARYPGCNWGVRPPLGVVVLDIDPRNGGDAELARLEAEHGALPGTLTARTGSGGFHYWLSYNGPTRGKLGKGIDVKSNSGYLVAPPSVHECGGTYEWIDQRPAAYAPGWVKAILNPPLIRRPGVGAPGDLAPLVRFVLGGTPNTDRNNRLYWAACRAAEKGLDALELLDAALQVGLTEPAALATIRSAQRTPPRAAPRSPAAAAFLGKRTA